jgi:hypothetical protein
LCTGHECFDWAVANFTSDIKNIGIIAYEIQDYGSDWAAGVKAAAETNGIRLLGNMYLQLLNLTLQQAVGLMVTQPVDA